MINNFPKQLKEGELAVRTEKLMKRFGRSEALRGLDLAVPDGAFYVLAGSNGAGKSTTMRVLLDLIRADEGVAQVFGVDTSVGAGVRAHIGWVPDRHDVHYSWMRAGALLAWHAAYFPAWDAAYAQHLTKSLSIRLDTKLGRLSKGEARRVQLVMALAHRPRLLLLDEPTDGLDPAARETVLRILSEHMADAPTTALVSTHLVYEMDGLADHVGVLHEGRMRVQVSRADLERLMRSYALEVPSEWGGEAVVSTQLTLVRRSGRQREARWMIWGDEAHVTSTLKDAGATVRGVDYVSLEDATVALMSAEGVEAQ